MTPARPHEGIPAQIARDIWSPDGSLLAIAHDPPNSVYGMYWRSYAVTLYDARTGKQRHSLTGSVHGPELWWSRDGSLLYGEATRSGVPEQLAWVASSGASAKKPFPAQTPDPSGTVTILITREKLVVQTLSTGDVLWSVPVEVLGGDVQVHIFAPGAVGQPFIFVGSRGRR